MLTDGQSMCLYYSTLTFCSIMRQKTFSTGMNCSPWPGSIRMEMALVISWHSESKACQHGWWWGCHTWSHHDMSTVMRVCQPTALLRSESRPTTRKEKVPSARLLWYILQKRVRNIRKDNNFHYILIRLCLTIGDSGETPHWKETDFPLSFETRELILCEFVVLWKHILIFKSKFPPKIHIETKLQ